MSHKQLQMHLDFLNSLHTDKVFLLKPLGNGIYLGKFWAGGVKVNGISEWRTMYFIRDFESTKFVGVVYDMFEDLHWYVDPTFRGKRIMFNALHSTILSQVFKTRYTIEITIDPDHSEYEASVKIATKLGFKKSEEAKNRFELNVADYSKFDF